MKMQPISRITVLASALFVTTAWGADGGGLANRISEQAVAYSTGSAPANPFYGEGAARLGYGSADSLADSRQGFGVQEIQRLQGIHGAPAAGPGASGVSGRSGYPANATAVERKRYLFGQ